jgi:uncharacterized membrane protein YcaP (DUF421 family)
METVIRVVIVYAAILVGLRLMGKRDFGELSPLELITLILIPDLVSQGVVRSDYSLTNSLIAIMTLFSLVLIISVFSHRFKKLEKLIDSEPTLLVAKGRFLTNNLNSERISPDEIYGEMHKAGVDKLSRVRWAVLESDGRIAIVPEDERQG